MCWIGAFFVAGLLKRRPPRAGERRPAPRLATCTPRAAYDDALAVLNKLRSTDHPAGQARAIEQYRAFCLLALGRASDAEQAIEAVVAAEPSYHPSDSDASPRVRSAFTTVRRRMLPNIIQQQSAMAKAAFDRKEFAVAADLFRQVLTALADPDVAAEAKQPPLVDLKQLAAASRSSARKPRPAASAASAAGAGPGRGCCRGTVPFRRHRAFTRSTTRT